jgi:SAM-dependent methyltransferase
VQRFNFDSDTFDASVTNFGIFFLSDLLKGMKETHRTPKPGGVAVLTCWESLDYIYEIFAKIEKLVKPAREITRPDFLLKWKDGATMERLLKDAGFVNIEMENVKSWFWGHDLINLCGGLGENMMGFAGEDYTLSEKERCIPCAKEYLRGEGKTLLIQEDGKVGVRMSAWVAKAIK